MGNMHLITGYAGSAHVAAADQGSFNAAVFGLDSYVLNIGSKLAANMINSNTCRIADGDIIMQGRHVRLNEDSYVDLAIQSGTQGMKRNDLVVARYTKNTDTGIEDCNLVVIQGTPTAGTPADPAYTEGDIFEHDATADMPLYRIPINGINVGTPVALFRTLEASMTEIFESLRDRVPVSRTIAGINLNADIAAQALLNALFTGTVRIPYPNASLIGTELPAAGTPGRIFFKKVG